MPYDELPVQEAWRQHGVFARNQLTAAGWTSQRIRTYVTLGRFVQHSEDVFSLAGAPLTAKGELWAAYLTGGPGAVVVGPSALALHGRSDWPARPWIAVPTHRHLGTQPFMAIRQRRPVEQLTRIRGILTSGLDESLVTCLRLLPRKEARALLHRALREGWADPDRLALAARISAGQRGAPQIRSLAAEARTGAHSEGERRLISLLKDSGLTGFVANHRVRDALGLIGIIDVAFPERRLAIEFDGQAFHIDADAFQRDRTRQNRLVAAGWTVLRFTWDDVVHRPHQVMAEITAALTRLSA